MDASPVSRNLLALLACRSSSSDVFLRGLRSFGSQRWRLDLEAVPPSAPATPVELADRKEMEVVAADKSSLRASCDKSLLNVRPHAMRIHTGSSPGSELDAPIQERTNRIPLLPELEICTDQTHARWCMPAVYFAESEFQTGLQKSVHGNGAEF